MEYFKLFRDLIEWSDDDKEGTTVLLLVAIGIEVTLVFDIDDDDGDDVVIVEVLSLLQKIGSIL